MFASHSKNGEVLKNRIHIHESLRLVGSGLRNQDRGNHIKYDKKSICKRRRVYLILHKHVSFG
jgi:hypothetical protein